MELQTRPVGGRYTAVKLRLEKPCGGFCKGTCTIPLLQHCCCQHTGVLIC